MIHDQWKQVHRQAEQWLFHAVPQIELDSNPANCDDLFFGDLIFVSFGALPFFGVFAADALQDIFTGDQCPLLPKCFQ